MLPSSNLGLVWGGVGRVVGGWVGVSEVEPEDAGEPEAIFRR